LKEERKKQTIQERTEETDKNKGSEEKRKKGEISSEASSRSLYL
jgi:hypothetical protein